MSEKIWIGKWITDASYDFGEGESPIPMEFRRDFLLKNKKIKTAWIDATAWGIYEIELNGKNWGRITLLQAVPLINISCNTSPMI